MNELSDQELREAVALFYDGNQAPQITAKGSGTVADEIIELAQEHGVTLCKNEALLTLLMTMDLGDSIPENLYVAIAQIIAFAYQLQEKIPTCQQ